MEDLLADRSIVEVTMSDIVLCQITQNPTIQ